MNRVVGLHLDKCSAIDKDAAFQLPRGARVTLIEGNADYCTRVRVTVPTEGEVTGYVPSARLGHNVQLVEPDLATWGQANPASLATKPDVATTMDEHAKQAADENDLKRWARERGIAFCPDPKINGGGVVVTTGNDKMAAAIAYATCTGDRERQSALRLLDEVVAQCFEANARAKNCPRRVSVDDERTRLTSGSGTTP